MSRQLVAGIDATVVAKYCVTWPEGELLDGETMELKCEVKTREI